MPMYSADQMNAGPTAAGCPGPGAACAAARRGRRIARAERWRTMRPTRSDDRRRSVARKLSRRRFLGVTAAAAAAASAGPAAAARELAGAGRIDDGSAPWFRRTRRWVQTNLNEQDPASYDAGALGRLLGARAGAGRDRERRRDRGLLPVALRVAPPRARARRPGPLRRDPARPRARRASTVLARMDSTRTYEDVFRAHPDWFARDAEGEPFRSGDLYTVCVNGPWVRECVPGDPARDRRALPAGRLHRQQLERPRPEAGLLLRPLPGGVPPTRRGSTCPARVDWDDAAYRAWIRWSYARRTEIWDAYNRVTHEAGGPDCDWLGMCQGDPVAMCGDFRDPTAIWSRSADRHARLAGAPAGRGLPGERDGRARSSTASSAGTSSSPRARPSTSGRRGRCSARRRSPSRRRGCGRSSGMAARHPAVVAPPRREPGGPPPAAHRRAAVAAGTPRTRRTSSTAGRSPRSASCGRRRTSTGTAEARRPCARWQPFAGAAEALSAPPAALARRPRRPRRARRAGARRARPAEPRGDVGRAVRGGAAVRRGGRRPRGDRRDEPLRRGGPAARRLRAGRPPRRPRDRRAPRLRRRPSRPRRGRAGTGTRYLRVDGAADRPPRSRASRTRTSSPFGGRLELVRADGRGARSRSRSCPDSPQSPPENVWMREPRTDDPRRSSCAAAGGRGRVAYLPADLDRCFGRDRIPDHGRLLANLVRWASRRPMPARGRGPGPARRPPLPAGGPARPPRRQPDEPGGLPAVRDGALPGRAPPRARGEAEGPAARPGPPARGRG